MASSVSRGQLARAILGLAGAYAIVTATLAEAPQARTQPPAFYRLMLGDVEITALSDGVFDLDTQKLVSDPNPPQVARLLQQSFEPEQLPTSVNTFLVNTGNRLILVDTGAASLFGPSLGRILPNLVASGYRPEQIDTVLITHMHPDHIGGLANNGRRVFPNATVYAEQREANYWLNPESLQNAPADRQAFFNGATAAIQPYAAAGRFKTFSGASLIAPGIHSVPAPGHTPGHTLYTVESRGKTLVIWGDLTEIASVQFTAPEVTIAFDSDPVETVQSRLDAYADAAKSDVLIACTHLPFPGLGHLSSEHGEYRWLPVDYDTLRPAGK